MKASQFHLPVSVQQMSGLKRWKPLMIDLVGGWKKPRPLIKL